MDKPAEESGQEAAVQRTTPWTTFAPVSNVSSSVSGTVAKTSSTLTHLLQTQNGNNNHTVVSFNSVQLLMITSLRWPRKLGGKCCILTKKYVDRKETD